MMARFYDTIWHHRPQWVKVDHISHYELTKDTWYFTVSAKQWVVYWTRYEHFWRCLNVLRSTTNFEHRLAFELITDTPYLTLTGEVLVVYYEYLREKWPFFLQHDRTIFSIKSCPVFLWAVPIDSPGQSTREIVTKKDTIYWLFPGKRQHVHSERLLLLPSIFPP